MVTIWLGKFTHTVMNVTTPSLFYGPKPEFRGLTRAMSDEIRKLLSVPDAGRDVLLSGSEFSFYFTEYFLLYILITFNYSFIGILL